MELNGKSLDQYSPEDLEKMEAFFLARASQKAESMDRRKDDYVEVRDNMIDNLLEKFIALNKELMERKKESWSELNTLITLKEEAFGTTDTPQKSHTFTHSNNKTRVMVQEAAIVTFDDTAANGAAKIKQFIKTLTTAETSDIIEMVMNLLGPDKEGNLNPRKMITLFAMKDKRAIRLAKEGKLIEPLFDEGVEIIRKAMRFDYNATYIDVQRRRGGDNKWESIKLNFASMPVGAAQSDD